MSNFAFGTYRISDLNPQHIEALKAAIASGITMIDTSSNYMDGGAERAIASAMRSFDEETCSSVEIVSKFGYIQNTNLALHKEEPFDEVVEYSADCFHSISKTFIDHQLTNSLKRLEMERLGCYLLHNPEYYLLDAINRGVDKDKRLDEMYRRILEAFTALELEIKSGRILSYGISSNSFAKESNAIDFLPYEDMITLAEDAAEEVGNKEHSFTTIELPINLLETEGLKCASWAKDNGLRVLVNRPLNANDGKLMYRLADYDYPVDYYHYLNELMENCDSDEFKPLYILLEQLDNNKHKFGWIGDYDSFLYSQIIPHIQKSLQELDEESIAAIFHPIDMFLQAYRKMVLFECSMSTRIALKDKLKDTTLTLQEFALRFLMQRESIDYILVGMRKPFYVNEILAM